MDVVSALFLFPASLVYILLITQLIDSVFCVLHSKMINVRRQLSSHFSRSFFLNVYDAFLVIASPLDQLFAGIVFFNIS